MPCVQRIEGAETSTLSLPVLPMLLLSTSLTLCPCVTNATTFRRTQCPMEVVEQQLFGILLTFSLQFLCNQVDDSWAD